MSESGSSPKTALDATSDYIAKLPLWEWREIAEIKVKDKELFIACAKQYIDWYKDAEFSNDYTRIRRIENGATERRYRP